VDVTFRAYLYLVGASLAWGGNAVAGKLAVGHISPMAFTCFRWALALAVITPFATRSLLQDRLVLVKAWPLLLTFGAVGFTGFNALLYLALHYTGAINVSIEQAGIPLMIFVGNFLFFSTSVYRSQMIGFALTLAGVALTAAHGDLGTLLSLDLNFGDALMLVAVFVYAGYTLSLRWKPELAWTSLLTMAAFGAFLASLPLLAAEYAAGQMQLPDQTGWIAVLYTALVPSLAAQIFYIWGVDLIGANRAGLFISLVPIFGTLLAIAFAGEVPHLYHGIALGLVMAGIVIAERFKPKAL
jgi:drug/metabolite transporter (DMT)-like permease